MAFAFGLIHGFGFAGALEELTSQQGVQLLSLVGFNLGVELGQLFIVACILPLFILLAKSAFISRYLITFTSTILGAVGIFWVIERLA